MSRGRAPLARSTAISRRRASSPADSAVRMPVMPTTTTSSEIAAKAASPAPITSQSWLRATPGMIALRASPR